MQTSPMEAGAHLQPSMPDEPIHGWQPLFIVRSALYEPTGSTLTVLKLSVPFCLWRR